MGHETLKWSEDLACGIKIIDEQHRGLLDMINDMLSHVSGDDAQEADYFGKMVDKAVDYTQVHFGTEEDIMEKAGFDGFKDHKKAHDAFIIAVLDNIWAFQNEKRINLEGFSTFLKDWVLTHIAVMDKQYFSYFKENPGLLQKLNL